MPRLDITQPFKSAQRKINVFLHRQKWKETLIFLAFVLLAFGFWYLQSLQQDYEIEKTIQVRYRNVPHEIAFSDSVPDKITVRIRDKGSVLLNYSYGRSFSPIDINMKDMPVNQGSIIVERKEIESDIYKQLMASTMLISYEPAQINITYSRRVEKNLPVVFNGNIQYAPGFHRAGETMITPSVVQVYAAQSVIDTLESIPTVFTEIKKADKTITKAVQLQKMEGVAVNPESVMLTLPIEQYTEKTLDIPVIVTGIPEDYTVRLFPSTIKVTSSLPLSKYKDLEAGQFEIRLSFNELEQNLTGVTSVQLNKQPSWIRSSSLSPNRIEFILEQNR